MPAPIDLTGRVFGKLVVLSCVIDAGERKWRCLCECGSEKTVSRGNLKNGSTNSCGCIKNTQGGLSRKHPLWKRWSQMIDRCENSQNKDFKNYGGRNISVCPRWRHFPFFLADMENTFISGSTLERIDNEKGYEAGNVIWASRQTQTNNRRNTVFVDTPWGRMPRGDAARRAGLKVDVIARRQELGWPMDRIFR